MAPDNADTSIADSSPDRRWWGRLFKIAPGELEALLWSCAYFFCLLSGYYILRPVRDAFGAAGGLEELKWLYLGTACSMLPASVVFAALTTRFARRTFIPIAYRFFAANILLFFVLLKTLPDSSLVYLKWAYFVWVSVFNLFVVSVFWSFMADIFTNPQGKRLFGFIAVGGTLGQVCGSFAARHLAESVGAVNLLLGSFLLLEAACWCVRRLNTLARRRPGRADQRPAEPPIGGRTLSGLKHIFQSPYLLGICLFMLCYALSNTFLYVTKIGVAIEQSADEDARVAFLANIDFWTGVLTVLAQIFLTSRVIAKIGVGLTLAILPIITLVGFAVLGTSFTHPGLVATVGTLVVFEAVRRASNYAFSRPAREVLYTVIPKEDKYKAKNLIDTFVYRSGDLIGVWGYVRLAREWATGPVLFVMVPLAAFWFVVALLLGRRQRALAAASQSTVRAP